MFSFNRVIVAIFALFTLAQSQQFLIQNWGNGEKATNYTYKSLEAGRFTVDWILGAGGNFVVGKGYRGNQNLYIPPPASLLSSHLANISQRGQLHSQLQPSGQLLPCPLWLHKQPTRRILRYGSLRRAQSLRQHRPIFLRLPQQ